MRAIRTAIPEVVVIEPRVFSDARGFFFESWNRRAFADIAGRDVEFVQDNHSASVQGVLRGLHYQMRQAQGKLVRVVAGEVYDVAVDLRRSSPTFGRWVGERLSAGNHRMMWVPPGFAHGFLVLSERAEFLLQDHRLLRPRARAHAALERPGARDRLAARRGAAAQAQGRRGRAPRAGGNLPVIRVLLTGAGGQVGGELARALAGRVELEAHGRASLDLADPDALARRVRQARARVIVNAAAYTAVDRAESEPERARAVNARAPAVLAEEARRAGALLVHYSTDYVFDGAKRAPYVEDDPPAPLGVYGRTKLEGEQAVAASGCEHLILRTSWVYGARGANFVRTMLRLGAEREALRVVDDQHGAPTSSAQLARATVRLIANDAGVIDAASVARAAAAGGLYHATAAGRTTWHGFALAIFEGWKRRRPDYRVPEVTPIPTSGYPTPARRPAWSVLSCDRLAATFGVRIPSWQEGLDEVLSELAAGA